MSIQNDIRTSQNDLRAISTLLGDALSQVAKLFQNEVDLAKAEFGEKVQKIGGRVGLHGGWRGTGDPRADDGAVRVVGGVDLGGMVATDFLLDLSDRGRGNRGRAVCDRD